MSEGERVVCVGKDGSKAVSLGDRKGRSVLVVNVGGETGRKSVILLRKHVRLKSRMSGNSVQREHRGVW